MAGLQGLPTTGGLLDLGAGWITMKATGLPSHPNSLSDAADNVI